MGQHKVSHIEQNKLVTTSVPMILVVRSPQYLMWGVHHTREDIHTQRATRLALNNRSVFLGKVLHNKVQQKQRQSTVGNKPA